MSELFPPPPYEISSAAATKPILKHSTDPAYYSSPPRDYS